MFHLTIGCDLELIYALCGIRSYMVSGDWLRSLHKNGRNMIKLIHDNEIGPSVDSFGESGCSCIHPSIHPCIHPSIHLSSCQPTYLPAHQSMRRSIHLLNLLSIPFIVNSVWVGVFTTYDDRFVSQGHKYVLQSVSQSVWSSFVPANFNVKMVAKLLENRC